MELQMMECSPIILVNSKLDPPAFHNELDRNSEELSSVSLLDIPSIEELSSVSCCWSPLKLEMDPPDFPDELDRDSDELFSVFSLDIPSPKISSFCRGEVKQTLLFYYSAMRRIHPKLVEEDSPHLHE